jgi:hypothetical protein
MDSEIKVNNIQKPMELQKEEPESHMLEVANLIANAVNQIRRQ